MLIFLSAPPILEKVLPMENNKDALLSRLRQTPLFAAWPEDVIVPLLAESRPLTLGSGDILFAEGSLARSFYFLASGRIDLIAAAATGQEKIVEIIQPDDLFAEAVAFLGGRYPVTAQADAATTVLEIPLNRFVESMEQRPLLMRQMLARLSMRLHFLVKELRHLSVESAEQRLVGYLLDLCPMVNGPTAVELPAKKAVVAARLGLTPETLSRVLTRIRKAGFIDVERRIITIPDPLALRRWAEGH
ncbi:Crp/Fnr family transcriptional regulator [Acidithiobacillus sp.]|jgi:CRP-like cAMP-binding protein|uniref:Crp/Fnr family transcriptional regulator n=1 Tax=Acidithiobacillus sp. TaxID=1872118 RepID=UPI0025C2BFE2|nr:Crp/Fnr family transcriptional regulator [Acidithiobacillus sp.]MCK9189437.1 Crp/Fnr family transcriptional regulator [Acidithiobacillus sp.]MCK9358982.1 Crp/Fnr family transcriptional regulator [Acidithiobacillus sp.]